MNAELEIGLKSQIKRQVGMKDWQKEKGLHAQDGMIEMWKILATDDAERWKTTLEEQIWNYVEKYALYIHINSSLVGLKTIIKDYKNAQGETKPAHFTQLYHYYGSTKKLGDEPVFYDGYFEINKNQFDISLERLCNLRKTGTLGDVSHYPLSTIFVPRRMVE